MSETANPTRQGGKTNLVLFVVALIALGIGGYFYAASAQPYYYESTGNIIRFGSLGLARDCSKLDITFPIDDDFDLHFTGQYFGTQGIFDTEAAFKMEIEGKLSGFSKELPFTRDELIEKITSFIDEKLQHGSESEIVELASPVLKGDIAAKAEKASKEPKTKKDDEKAKADPPA